MCEPCIIITFLYLYRPFFPLMSSIIPKKSMLYYSPESRPEKQSKNHPRCWLIASFVIFQENRRGFISKLPAGTRSRGDDTKRNYFIRRALPVSCNSLAFRVTTTTLLATCSLRCGQWLLYLFHYSMLPSVQPVSVRI